MPEFRYAPKPDPEKEPFFNKLLTGRLDVNHVGLLWLGVAFAFGFLAMSLISNASFMLVILVSLVQLSWHIFSLVMIRRTPVRLARTIWSVVLALIIALGGYSIFMVLQMAGSVTS